MAQTQQAKRRIVNGTWYEVCVSQGGEVRDVLIESSLYNAENRAEQLAAQWPDCDLIRVRQHRVDPERGEGCSKFVVLHKLTLDFRAAQQEVR